MCACGGENKESVPGGSAPKAPGPAGLARTAGFVSRCHYKLVSAYAVEKKTVLSQLLHRKLFSFGTTHGNQVYTARRRAEAAGKGSKREWVACL